MKKKNTYVDRFRDRIIFPINSISGLPIAIGGRIMEKNSFFAKYINSPETQFFKKETIFTILIKLELSQISLIKFF